MPFQAQSSCHRTVRSVITRYADFVDSQSLDHPLTTMDFIAVHKYTCLHFNRLGNASAYAYFELIVFSLVFWRKWVRSRYNAVMFLWKSHERRPIPRPWRRDMGVIPESKFWTSCIIVTVVLSVSSCYRWPRYMFYRQSINYLHFLSLLYIDLIWALFSFPGKMKPVHVLCA